MELSVQMSCSPGVVDGALPGVSRYVDLFSPSTTFTVCRVDRATPFRYFSTAAVGPTPTKTSGPSSLAFAVTLASPNKASGRDEASAPSALRFTASLVIA